MTITAFDKTNLRALRTDLNIALAAVCREHGISIDIGNMQFSANEVRCKMEIKTRAAITAPSYATGAMPQPPVTVTSALARTATTYGLDVNKRGPKGERLVDFQPSRRKYPFTYETIRGTRYKTDINAAQRMFGA